MRLQARAMKRGQTTHRLGTIDQEQTRRLTETREDGKDKHDPVHASSDASGDGQVEQRRQDLGPVRDQLGSLSKVGEHDADVDEPKAGSDRGWVELADWGAKDDTRRVRQIARPTPEGSARDVRDAIMASDPVRPRMTPDRAS
jgi:hypothetical protein